MDWRTASGTVECGRSPAGVLYPDEDVPGEADLDQGSDVPGCSSTSASASRTTCATAAAAGGGTASAGAAGGLLPGGLDPAAWDPAACTGGPGPGGLVPAGLAVTRTSRLWPRMSLRPARSGPGGLAGPVGAPPDLLHQRDAAAERPTMLAAPLVLFLGQRASVEHASRRGAVLAASRRGTAPRTVPGFPGPPGQGRVSRGGPALQRGGPSTRRPPVPAGSPGRQRGVGPDGLAEHGPGQKPRRRRPRATWPAGPR